MQYLVSVVAFSVGDMHPFVVDFVDQLVELNVSGLLHIDDLVEEHPVTGWISDGDVSRFTEQMLAGLGSADSLIQHLTP